MDKSINKTLNFFKGISCMFVVLLHVQFPNSIVIGVTQALARIAIPIFFMISGYFSYNASLSDLNKNMPRKIKHILKLCIAATLFWLVFQIIACVFGGDQRDIRELFVDKWFNFKSLLKWIFFNVDPFINILWFLFALLYCYLVFWGIGNLKIGKIAYYVFIPLLIVLYGIECSTLFGVSMPTFYYRNCWLFGLPLFYLGNFLNYFFQQRIIKIKNCYLIIAIIGGEILSLLEWSILGIQELYIGSMISAIAIMIFSIKNPVLEMNKIGKIIEFIGGKLSFTIYIIHISIFILFNKLLKIIDIYENASLFLLYLRPFIVIFLSCLVSFIWYKVVSRWRRKKS